VAGNGLAEGSTADGVPNRRKKLADEDFREKAMV
jgi:hypothetical protein